MLPRSATRDRDVMTDLKTLVSNAIQRTVEKIEPYDEITVKRHLVETPATSEQLPRTHWIVYEFSEYIICVPEGGTLNSNAAKSWNK